MNLKGFQYLNADDESFSNDLMRIVGVVHTPTVGGASKQPLRQHITTQRIASHACGTQKEILNDISAVIACHNCLVM